MLWLEELIEAYADEYRSESKKRRKNARRPGDYKNRLSRLYTALKRSKEHQMTTRHLEDYHRQVKNLSYFAFRSQDAAVIGQICGQILPELARLDLALFLPGQREHLSRDFLDYMKTEQSGEICSRPLIELYPSCGPHKQRENLPRLGTAERSLLRRLLRAPAAPGLRGV